MSFKMYIAKRAIAYAIVFFIAISLIWLLIRLAPGDPVKSAVMRIAMAPGVRYTEEQIKIFEEKAKQMYGLDRPMYEQFARFWGGILTGDWGFSLWAGGSALPTVVTYVKRDLVLLLPVIMVSWVLGNWIGAIAARYRKLDRVLIPIIYIFTSIPYFILGLVFAYLLGVVYNVFPVTVRSEDIDNFLASPNAETFTRFIRAYTLPFVSLLLVTLGGWASGMRTLMMYELESNYARFMESLGLSERKISSYAFRFAINPQIAGLAIQLGTVITGGLVLSGVFSYPGAGIALIYAINFRDLFLLQSVAVFYTMMVIVANFIVEVVYALLDPRIRLGVVGV